MTADGAWGDAPCGLVVTDREGRLLQVNRALCDWTGLTGPTGTLAALLTVGGRIFWETHLGPLLRVEGRVDEVALELRLPDGGRMPVLLSAVVRDDRVHVALASARQRAGFERELVAARAAADSSAGRLQALQETTAALSRAVGVQAVAEALLTAAVTTLGGRTATVWTTDDDDVLVARAARGEEAGSSPADAAGRVGVPLPGQAALRGVLSLLPDDAVGAAPVDPALVTAVGQQGGLALDRARLYEQSADVARELQQSLLADPPPHDPRFGVATVYRPGVERLEVGGDWWDVFLVEEGRLAVVVGDVVGRGLGAASAMGQLRSAVRAVAGPGVGPARLLARLDRFVEQVEAARMATLAYAELELDTGRLTWACAGHPPPLLLRADGGPQLLWDGRSTPLGGFVQAPERTEAQVVLAPSDRLLLCTDGLFERRDRDLDAGLDLLAVEADRLGRLPLEEAVRSVTRTLLRDEVTRDDVCVLLLAWTGTSFARSLRADLAALSSSRRDLRTWLAGQGVVGDPAEDLVLATSEAVANAAEHGAGRRPDTWVSLQAQVRDDDLVVTVDDPGQWRPSSGSVERGRGLAIVRRLVDDLQVLPGEDGTRLVLRSRLPAAPC